MAYTPTEWKTGDVITAEKLNKLENGVGGNSSVNVVFITDTLGHLDKTAGELYSMFESNNYFMVVISEEYSEIYGIITKIIHDEGYAIKADMLSGGSSNDGAWYTASSADSYPTLMD